MGIVIIVPKAMYKSSISEPMPIQVIELQPDPILEAADELIGQIEAKRAAHARIYEESILKKKLAYNKYINKWRRRFFLKPKSIAETSEDGKWIRFDDGSVSVSWDFILSKSYARVQYEKLLQIKSLAQKAKVEGTTVKLNYSLIQALEGLDPTKLLGA